jgi:hypothetical protein
MTVLFSNVKIHLYCSGNEQFGSVSLFYCSDDNEEEDEEEVGDSDSEDDVSLSQLSVKSTPRGKKIK